MQVQLKPRSVGEQIGLTFSLTMAHFPKLLLLMAVLNLPAVWVQYSAAEIDPMLDPGTSLAYMLGGVLITLVTSSIGTGAAILLVAGSFTGNPIGLIESVSRGLQRFFGILGVSMMVGLVVAIGCLLFIIPGMILLTGLYAAVCVLLVEKKSVFESMSRSRALVKGNGWPVFGIIVLIVMLVGAIVGGANIVLSISGGLDATGNPTSLAGFFGLWAIGVVTSLFTTVSPVVVYFDLRVKKESFDVQTLTDLVADIGRRRGTSSEPG